MTSIDVIFSRTMMVNVHKEVRKHFPHILVRKAAWTWCAGRGHWEFHGPDKFFWHGRAGNGYDARAKGWLAWLSSKGIGEEA